MATCLVASGAEVNNPHALLAIREEPSSPPTGISEDTHTGWTGRVHCQTYHSLEEEEEEGKGNNDDVKSKR